MNKRKTKERAYECKEMVRSYGAFSRGVVGGCVPEKYRFRLAYGLWAAASSSQFLNSSVSQCVGFCFACRLLRRHSPHFPRWSEKCSKKKKTKKKWSEDHCIMPAFVRVCVRRRLIFPLFFNIRKS